MKIRRIELKNFRNFKDHRVIDCSTDGKFTIIYGKNGDGKTTLHQLFQWILYDQLSFNKTTTDRLYNLSFEDSLPYNSTFDVMGRLDFEDSGVEYSLTRTAKYKKNIEGSEKQSQELNLNYKDDNGSWIRYDGDPQIIIEKMLPRGLKDYFFFDGEGMISDLRYQGKDSAENLKNALYSMFDLDIIDAAIEHIGREDLKSTVLGKLYLQKSDLASDETVKAAKSAVENIQRNLTRIEEEDFKNRDERKKLKALCDEISETIGMSQSRAVYEQQIQMQIRNRDQFLTNVKDLEKEFGDQVVSVYPKLLMAKAVEYARKSIQSNLQEAKCPPGLEKALIKYLQSGTAVCICGKPIDEHSRDCFKVLEKMFQPYSNDAAYSDFIRQAEAIGRGFDRNALNNKLIKAADNYNSARDCDNQIKSLEKDIKNISEESERLIEQRSKAREKLQNLDVAIESATVERRKFKARLKQAMDKYNELTDKTELGRIAEYKIHIMEEVLKALQHKLDTESLNYSKKLQFNIDNLLDQMLTSKRSVKVSKDFSMAITDSYNDESKSEGQFAVVSFAYIGGILKVLKDELSLNSKEYPLVLDGPFSKLDEDQRQNVIDCLPSFAPQVILFSKDSLQDYIPDEMIGKVYTLVSNDEKNIAEIKDGFLWN